MSTHASRSPAPTPDGPAADVAARAVDDTARSVDDTARAAARQRWLGIAALVLCAALWSLNGPLVKLLSSERVGERAVPDIAIAAYRSLIGGLFFLPLAWSRRRSLAEAPPRWLVASLLTFTLMTACFVVATARTAAANAIILQYTSPIWVFVLSPLLLGESPRWRDAGWLALSMAGVALILAWQWQTDLAGLTIALTAGLGYGSLTVVLRRLRRVDPTAIVAWNCLGSGLVLLPWALWRGMELSGLQAALVLGMGVVQFALPYVIFSWALARVPAYQASLIVLLECVLNPVLTWLAVGERVPAATLLGGPLILAGVAGWILATWLRERAAPPAH